MERLKILYDTWKKLGTTRKTKLDMTHSSSNDSTHLNSILYVKNTFRFRIKCALIFAQGMGIFNLSFVTDNIIDNYIV